jgi:hypothetical protein
MVKRRQPSHDLAAQYHESPNKQIIFILQFISRNLEKGHQRYGQTKNYSHIFSLKQELG